MSPFEFEFLSWCYTRVCAHPLYAGSEILQRFATSMVEDGILKPSDDYGFTVTDKGKFWINDILSTPMPIQQWVSGRETHKETPDAKD